MMFWIGLACAASLSAAPANKPGVPKSPLKPMLKESEAEAAFAFLKKLDGLWQSEPQGSDEQQATWRLMAGGTSVLQTVTSPDSAVSTNVVYLFIGKELVAVHTSSSGLSHLRLSRVEPQAIAFDGVISSERVVSFIIRLDGARLQEEWTLREGSRAEKRSRTWVRAYVDSLQ